MNRIVNTNRTWLTAKADYETPNWLFEWLNYEFNFDLDCAATSNNTKCKHFISPEQDALKTEWHNFLDKMKNPTCWLNPPYSRKISLWMAKAYRESKRGCRAVVCLIPVSTGTIWWHDYVLLADEIRFITGRVNFIGGPASPTFDSCLVIYRDRGKREKPNVKWIDYGRESKHE